MNKSLFILAGAALMLSSCKSKNKDDVVAERYTHKYGYDVAKTTWEEESIPGKKLTTFRNGITVTESYEDARLHGEKTITFKHSQTIQTKEVYNKGILVKRTNFSIRGIPEKETVFKSPTHLIVSTWHSTGSPKAKEEYKNSKLVNGQYFSLENETVSCINDGHGEKTIYNASGDIISKEVYVNYDIAYTETYHINHTPHIITSYKDGKIHGEKKEFALSGEPLYVENYENGEKDGLCTYYQNGYKYQETTYTAGRKNGIERLYIDGVTLAEETEYRLGAKHGPSVVFCDGSALTAWYFNDTKVTKAMFDQYEERDFMITSVQ